MSSITCWIILKINTTVPRIIRLPSAFAAAAVAQQLAQTSHLTHTRTVRLTVTQRDATNASNNAVMWPRGRLRLSMVQARN
ncbi:hypothetical protein ABVT39_000117 [Epinephelus coioides]